MKPHKKGIKQIFPILDKASPIAIVLVGIVTVIAFYLEPNPTELTRTLKLILALVTILAISSLWDKIKFYLEFDEKLRGIKDLIEKSRISSIISADEFFSGSNQPDPEFISSANKIYLCGVTLGGKTRDFNQTLTNRLEAGAEIKIILIDKQSDEVLNQIVKRSWSDRASREGYKKILEGTEELLNHISNTKKATGTFQIGYLSSIPTCGMTMIDPDLRSGKAHIKFFRHGEKGGFEFRVDNLSEPQTFARFFSEFQSMWKSCRVENLLK